MVRDLDNFGFSHDDVIVKDFTSDTDAS